MAYMGLMNWNNFPSIACLCTIIWDVKGYLVRTKCNGGSYVIFLLIPPLHHLKHKNLTQLSFKTKIKFIFTYCKAHLQVFGNHKVAVVPVVLQAFNCEVDLSTVLTGMFSRCHFLHYSSPRKVGSRKYSTPTTKTKQPSFYHFKLVWKGFLGAASADKV